MDDYKLIDIKHLLVSLRIACLEMHQIQLILLACLSVTLVRI